MKKLLSILVLFLVMSFSTYSQVNLQQGLVASYRLDGNANDDSGNNLNGTITGATSIADRFGVASHAYNFATSTSHISVPSNSLFNTGDELSVSVWVKLTNSTNNQKVIGRCDLSFNSGFLLGVQSGHMYPELWNSQGTHYQMTAAGTIASAQWVHLCITYANSLYFTAWVNGVAVDSVPVAAYPMGSNTDNLVVGIAPWNLVNYPVAGGIDDIRIYNRAITPDEVLALYNLNPVGIQSPSATNEVNIFPNPSNNGKFVLSNAEETISVTIFNTLGEMVYYKEMNHENRTELDLSSLNKGVYFMNLSKGEQVVRKEIVIN